MKGNIDPKKVMQEISENLNGIDFSQFKKGELPKEEIQQFKKRFDGNGV